MTGVKIGYLQYSRRRLVLCTSRYRLPRQGDTRNAMLPDTMRYIFCQRLTSNRLNISTPEGIPVTSHKLLHHVSPPYTKIPVGWLGAIFRRHTRIRDPSTALAAKMCESASTRLVTPTLAWPSRPSGPAALDPIAKTKSSLVSFDRPHRTCAAVSPTTWTSHSRSPPGCSRVIRLRKPCQAPMSYT